jgi:hypothetical protein
MTRRTAPGTSALCWLADPTLEPSAARFRRQISSMSAGDNGWRPAEVTWIASDNVGITSQTIHWESLNANFETAGIVDVNSPTARQFSQIPYYPFGALRVQIDAYDNAANHGEEVDGCSGSIVQSEDFTAGPGWAPVACRLFFQQRQTLRTTTSGAFLTYQFTGQSIALIGDFAGGAPWTFKGLHRRRRSGLHLLRARHAEEDGGGLPKAVPHQRRPNPEGRRDLRPGRHRRVGDPGRIVPLFVQPCDPSASHWPSRTERECGALPPTSASTQVETPAENDSRVRQPGIRPWVWAWGG